MKNWRCPEMENEKMENLKETLFKNCYKSVNAYLNDKKQFGEYHKFTRCSHAAFCALYQVIEDCKLEEDYQTWKEGCSAALSKGGKR